MGRLKMSFFRGTLDREELVNFIETTDKPVWYTHGLSYRRPTTFKVPIGKDKAIKIAKNESMLDVDEMDDYIHMNTFSGNDML